MTSPSSPESADPAPEQPQAPPEAPEQADPAAEQPAAAPEPAAAPAAADDSPAAPLAEQAEPAIAEPGADEASEDHAPAAALAEQAAPHEGAAPSRKKRKKRKKAAGEPAPADGQGTANQPTAETGGGDQASAEQPKPKPKPQGPSPTEIVRRIGTSNAQVLAYVRDPDPKLARLSRKVREAVLPDLPPVTGGALHGPEGLARHFVASASAGRYRDLFALWELFRTFPEPCKPVLAERQAALAKGRRKLRVATILGLVGSAERVAEDVRTAEGLIWQWLREVLMERLQLVGRRPAVAAALLEREPDLALPLPGQPDPTWLSEAAAVRNLGALPGPLEALLAANVHRLPATVETLRLATRHYPDRVEGLLDQVDLDAEDVGAFLAWARDHGASDRLHARIRDRVSAAAARDRAKGLELWHTWRQRGVDLKLPDSLRTDSLEGFDLSRPETAELAAHLLAQGVQIDVQAQLDELAGQNRQLAEKAYEAMVCANLDVTLPAALEGNPTVNEGTRCPNCRAWTWVRPGHEQRCPRPPGSAPQPEPDPFDFAAAQVAAAEASAPEGS